MDTLSVIIANYNTKDILRQCLEALTDAYVPMEILVVDNASTDGSSAMVKSVFPSVKLINSENKGIAHAYNLGVAQSIGSHIAFMGTDAFVKKGDFAQMLEYMKENPDIGILTAKLVTRDGELDMDAHRGLPTPRNAFFHFTKINRLFPKSKFFNGYFMGWCDMTVPHEIDICISHFMLTRRDVFDQVGGFSEDYFVFGEDVDFCYMVKKAGYKIVYAPQWTVVHYKGVGVGRKTSSDIKTASNTSSSTRKRMRIESVRAMQMFYNKHMRSHYSALTNLLVDASIKLLYWIRR